MRSILDNGGFIGVNRSVASTPSSIWNLQALYDSPAPMLVTNGLMLHLDAGNTASYSGTGTTWTDLSGNGNNFVLNSSSVYQTSGGIAHMNFDGASTIATLGGGNTDITAYANVTIMVFTAILNSNSSWRTMLRGYGNGLHQVIISSGGTTLGLYNGGFYSSGFDITSLPSPYTQFNCLTWRMKQSASPYYRFSYNAGTTIYDINDSGAAWGGFNAIGNWQGGGQPWGKIAVVLYYNRALTDAEVTQNYNVYKAKFGLP